MGNREALVQGARECLLEQGYAAVTARDIAGRAGTSLAAIGYHFGSTQALLHEAIAESFRQWRAELGAVLETDAPPAEIIAAVGAKLDQLFVEDRELFTVFLEALALARRAPDVGRQAAANYDEDRLAVASLVASVRGAASDEDRTVASLLLAVVDGLFIQQLLDHRRAPKPSAVIALLTPTILGVQGRRKTRVR